MYDILPNWKRKEKTMEKFGETMKKVLLAGVGTIATTAEKSKEILDEMVKKGELTVEQGKVLNQELKHNIKKTVKDNVNISIKASSPEELSELLKTMTSEQLAQIKEQIQAMEAANEQKKEVSDENAEAKEESNE